MGPSDRKALQLDFSLGASGRDVIDTGLWFLITNSKYRTLRSRGALWLLGFRYLQEQTTVERVAPGTTNPFYSGRPTDSVRLAAFLPQLGLGYRGEIKSFGVMPFVTLGATWGWWSGQVGDRPLESGDPSSRLWDKANFTVASFGVQTDFAVRPKLRLGVIGKYMLTNAVYLDPRLFVGLNIMIEGPGPAALAQEASESNPSSECTATFPLIKPAYCR